MAKTIVIVGTLDTKGEEIKYLKGLIEEKGHKTVVIDNSLLGEPLFAPDISRDEVARAAGTTMAEVMALGSEAKEMAVMAEGASKIAQQLHLQGQLDGIIALGGSMGTSLGLPVMKALPFGVPKLMVSTIAFTPLVTSEVVGEDLTMMRSAADIWGLNWITEMTIRSAAGAICGMAETYERMEAPAKPLIGVTTLGIRGCRWVPQVKPLLQERGYEVAVFHTVGMGGKTFEHFIDQGLIAGALDLSTHELTNWLCGGVNNAGPDRLEAAGRKGIPQVVAPGVLSWFGWSGSLDTIPPRFRRRKIYQHNALASGIMASIKEMAALGKLIAEKLNKAKGPTAVLIPKRGFEEMDRPGSFFYFPKGRRAFAQALKEHIRPEVKVIELDVHISDPEFAEQAVALLDEMMSAKQQMPVSLH